MRISHALTATALALTLTCCAPPPPAPAPAPPPPPPPAAPAPAPTSWQDAPLTPGSWRYQAGEALFYGGSNSGTAIFRIRCNTQRRTVMFIPAPQTMPVAGGSVAITTTFAARTVAATASPEGVAAEIAAFDGFVDGVAYSRGRIMIGLPMGDRLILPAWPEIARVIEDCRQ